MIILTHSIFDLGLAQTVFLSATILAAFGLIFIIYSRSRESIKSRLFILILVLVICYLLSHAFHFLIMHSNNIIILDKSCHSFLLLIVVTITFFSWNFPVPHKMGLTRSLIIILPSVLLLNLLWTGYFIEESHVHEHTFVAVFSPAYPLFLIWYAFLIGLNFVWLLRKYNLETDEQIKKRILTFLVGFVITILASFLFGLFLPWYLGFYYLVEVSPLAFLVGVILFTTIAVSKYNMFPSSFGRFNSLSITKKIFLSALVLVPIIILLVQIPLIRILFQNEPNKELTHYFFVSVFGGLIVSISIAFVIVRIISNPLNKLKNKVHEIEKGNYDIKIGFTSNDEIGELTEAFNNMSDTLKNTTSELIKREKLAALGQMAAVLAHEIKAPLTSIKMNADIISETMQLNEDEKGNFYIIQTEINRLNNLVKDVLQFSRQMELEYNDVNLYELIESIRFQLTKELDEKKIAFINNTNKIEIAADVYKLKQVFLNLVDNSIEAIDNSGEIEISSTIEIGEVEKIIIIMVRDTGEGIKDDMKVFEPFFTTKSSGTGLGLSVAQKIIEQHKGTIKLVLSEPGETMFEITLPLKEVSLTDDLSSLEKEKNVE